MFRLLNVGVFYSSHDVWIKTPFVSFEKEKKWLIGNSTNN